MKVLGLFRLLAQLVMGVLRPGSSVMVPPPVARSRFTLGSDLASKIIRAMERKGYAVSAAPGTFNMIYVEGMDVDGTPNHNRFNAFDDIRVLIQVADGGVPKIVHVGEATTEPGKFWTDNRMNPDGAFHIALGPQTCWRMGEYHNAPALVQCLPIKGYRDGQNHYRREGPLLTEPDIGVHHHGGYNLSRDDLGRSSAGCQVERLVSGHLQSMTILKSDARYRANPNFVFTSTVLSAAEIV